MGAEVKLSQTEQQFAEKIKKGQHTIAKKTVVQHRTVDETLRLVKGQLKTAKKMQQNSIRPVKDRKKKAGDGKRR